MIISFLKEKFILLVKLRKKSGFVIYIVGKAKKEMRICDLYALLDIVTLWTFSL